MDDKYDKMEEMMRNYSSDWYNQYYGVRSPFSDPPPCYENPPRYENPPAYFCTERHAPPQNQPQYQPQCQPQYQAQYQPYDSYDNWKKETRRRKEEPDRWNKSSSSEIDPYGSKNVYSPPVDLGLLKCPAGMQDGFHDFVHAVLSPSDKTKVKTRGLDEFSRPFHPESSSLYVKPGSEAYKRMKEIENSPVRRKNNTVEEAHQRNREKTRALNEYLNWMDLDHYQEPGDGSDRQHFTIPKMPKEIFGGCDQRILPERPNSFTNPLIAELLGRNSTNQPQQSDSGQQQQSDSRRQQSKDPRNPNPPMSKQPQQTSSHGDRQPEDGSSRNKRKQDTSHESRIRKRWDPSVPPMDNTQWDELMQGVQILNGSFHQGNIPYITPAGNQCTAIAAVAAALNTITPVESWSQSDLDTVIVTGDAFYRRQRHLLPRDRLHNLLEAREVEGNVTVENQNVRITPVDGESSIAFRDGFVQAHPIDGYFTLPQMFSEYLNSNDAALLTAGAVSLAILPRDNVVAVVDSHSKDSSGRPTPDGAASVLLFPRSDFPERFSNYLNQIIPVERYDPHRPPVENYAINQVNLTPLHFVIATNEQPQSRSSQSQPQPATPTRSPTQTQQFSSPSSYPTQPQPFSTQSSSPTQSQPFSTPSTSPSQQPFSTPSSSPTQPQPTIILNPGQCEVGYRSRTKCPQNRNVNSIRPVSELSSDKIQLLKKRMYASTGNENLIPSSTICDHHIKEVLELFKNRQKQFGCCNPPGTTPHKKTRNGIAVVTPEMEDRFNNPFLISGRYLCTRCRLQVGHLDNSTTMSSSSSIGPASPSSPTQFSPFTRFRNVCKSINITPLRRRDTRSKTLPKVRGVFKNMQERLLSNLKKAVSQPSALDSFL